MNEDKATRYHRLGRRAGLLSTVWTAAILCALMFSRGIGGSAATDRRQSSRRIRALTVALYVLVLSVLFDLATLPFGFYRGFILERRYGLATQTHEALGQGPFQSRSGRVCCSRSSAPRSCTSRCETGPTIGGFLPVWVIRIVIVVLVNLAPVVLLPLFYTFRPLERAELRDRLTALASKDGRPHPGRV